MISGLFVKKILTKQCWCAHLVVDMPEATISGKNMKRVVKQAAGASLLRSPGPKLAGTCVGIQQGATPLSPFLQSNKLFKQHTLYSGLAGICVTSQSHRAWDLLNKCHIYQYLKHKNIPPSLPQPHKAVSLVKSDGIICFFKG